MLVQPSCNARFHLTSFNIDSLPHANRTTLHFIEVAFLGGKFPLKRTLNLMCIFRILKKSLIASTKALIYFTIRSGVASVDNWRGEYSYMVFCLTNFFLNPLFLWSLNLNI